MKQKANKFMGKWLVAVLAIAFGAVLYLGLSMLRPQPAAEAPRAAPNSPAALLDEVSLEGRIQARSALAVPVPIEGVIDFLDVEVGQQVSENQLLARIKSEVSETHRQIAQAELDQAQSRLNILESEITAARLEASRVRAEATRARSELERTEKANARQRMLLNAGATPRVVAERAEEDYRKAAQESKILSEAAGQSEERIRNMQQDSDALRKTLAEKTAELEEANAEVAAGEVRSPVDGIVTARRGSSGEQVGPAIKDFFQIATDISALEVVVEPPPDILAHVKQGQPAVVRVAELSGEGLPGVVRKVENGRATVEFTSPLPEIKPGLTAQVLIKLT